MKQSVVFLAGLAGVFLPSHLGAADATSPVDYTQRNNAFAPGKSEQPVKRTPQTQDAIQDKRVTTGMIDKTPAAVGDRRAAIDVTETREKMVREKQTRPLEKKETARSPLDQQRSRFSTAEDTSKPPMVAKYQDSLVAASASNMARFPAIDRTTSTTVNRFVFRKNGGALADAPQTAPIVPAAGGGLPVR